MQVRDGMSDVVLTIGPDHTLRDAAAAMCQRKVGAAVVLDPDAPGPGVITERDVLRAVAEGKDPDQEHVSGYLTADLTLAAPDWSLEHAATAMVRGRLSSPARRRRRRDGRNPVHARHRALLDPGRGDERDAGLGGLTVGGAIASSLGGSQAPREPRRVTAAAQCPWDSGSSPMSRRVSRIQRIVVSTKMIAPTIEMARPSVVPMTIRVIPIALRNGISDGPGRWISSPTGGASWGCSAHACT